MVSLAFFRREVRVEGLLLREGGPDDDGIALAVYRNLPRNDALDFLARELVGPARNANEVIELVRLRGGSADEGEGGILYVVCFVIRIN